MPDTARCIQLQWHAGRLRCGQLGWAHGSLPTSTSFSLLLFSAVSVLLLFWIITIGIMIAWVLSMCCVRCASKPQIIDADAVVAVHLGT